MELFLFSPFLRFSLSFSLFFGCLNLLFYSLSNHIILFCFVFELQLNSESESCCTPAPFRVLFSNHDRTRDSFLSPCHARQQSHSFKEWDGLHGGLARIGLDQSQHPHFLLATRLDNAWGKCRAPGTFTKFHNFI